MGTTLTRVFYCKECAERGRPRTGQEFMAYGSSHAKYKALKAQNWGVEGFTPHTFVIERATDGIVTTSSACCMYGCGVDKELRNNTWWYFIKKDAWHIVTFKVSDWNSLVLYKGDKQYLI